MWGDWDPRNNNTTQHDTLRGGAGNDWLYSSHGQNALFGGPGTDHIWAYYGHGLIDCGPRQARHRTNQARLVVHDPQLRDDRPLLRVRTQRPRRLPKTRRAPHHEEQPHR